MTWGPLAQAGGRLTPEPRGGGASPPEPHKGGAGYRMGCSREKGKTQPPHMPTRLVKQRQAGPQLRRQNPRLASFIRAASSQCCVGCGQVVRVCAWARVCV